MPYLLAVLLLGFPTNPATLTVPKAEAAEYVPDFTSTTTVAAYIALEAQKWGISDDLAQYVASHESGYDIHARGDQEPMADGIPANARGLWQITSKYNPTVTDAEADDPVFATNFAMPILKDKQRCIREFTACRNYYEGI